MGAASEVGSGESSSDALAGAVPRRLITVQALADFARVAPLAHRASHRRGGG